MHNYMLYNKAVKLLGVSGHDNQLAKRKAKYPNHFKQDEKGQLFISIVLYNALLQYKAALQVLTTLQTQGGKKCTLK